MLCLTAYIPCVYQQGGLCYGNETEGGVWTSTAGDERVVQRKSRDLKHF
jgi:hypothetical protein